MVRMAGKRRGGAVKNSPNPYHRARWEVQELRAFAALRNRREQQRRRFLKSRAFPFSSSRRANVIKKARLLRYQRQDGVRR